MDMAFESKRVVHRYIKGVDLLEVVIDPDAMVFPMIGPWMSYDQIITGPFMDGKDPDPEIDGNDPKSMF